MQPARIPGPLIRFGDDEGRRRCRFRDYGGRVGTAEPTETAASARQRHPRRPGSVVLAVALVSMSGVISTVQGVLVLLSRYDVEQDEMTAVSLIGAATALFGLLTLAVASGIARGSRLSRILATVYIVVQVPLHIVTIVLADTWDIISTVEAVLDVVVLVIMWTPPGARHFSSRQPAPDPYAP